jgi:hypothetical protein
MDSGNDYFTFEWGQLLRASPTYYVKGIGSVKNKEDD